MFLSAFRSLNVTESKTLWGDDLGKQCVHP